MVTAIRSPYRYSNPFVLSAGMTASIHPASLLQDVPRRTGDYRPEILTADSARQYERRAGTAERRLRQLAAETICGKTA